MHNKRILWYLFSAVLQTIRKCGCWHKNMEERIWKYGNYAYYASIILFPFSVCLGVLQYGGNLTEAFILGVPCFIGYIVLRPMETLAELGEDYSWENPTKKKGYISKLILLSFAVVVLLVASLFFTIGLWQLVVALYLLGTLLHNYACKISKYC